MAMLSCFEGTDNSHGNVSVEELEVAVCFYFWLFGRN